MSAARIKELHEQRRKTLADARAINDKAAAENRDLTTEEREAFDRAFVAAEKDKAEIERLTKLEDAERDALQFDGEARARNLFDNGGGNGGGDGGRRDSNDGPRGLELRAMQTFALPGAEVPTAEEIRSLRSLRKAFRGGVGGLAALTAEERAALQADVGEMGGMIQTPQVFVASLIKAVDDAVFIRRLATVHPVMSSEGMASPSLDADPDDAEWTSEIGTAPTDSAMRFGRRELKPNPLAKLIKISKTLLRQSAIPAEALVRDRMAYKFGITCEKHYLTGTGDRQPLGIFTASNNGIPTSRDVATDNTSTAPTGDGLINTKYALKQPYWARAEWIFHRDVVKVIAKLKDDDGQYLWREGLRAGEPDRLLNLPVNMSEYAPNTLTTGQYVGVLGDFSHYWIADALSLQITMLNELFALNNLAGFLGRLETDGMPVLGEAFARVKLG